ncbi:hypothetical protein AX17_001053 [Amanita inopinata Kibby_2008]|nr:hypothetical protein AX17_001053 [Amanita inopinata Kibby_2008]
MYGFNHTTWNAIPRMEQAAVDARQNGAHRSRAMSGPSHPHVLIAGHRPSTVHSPNIFFAAAPSNNNSRRPIPSAESSTSSSPQPSSPAFHRSLTCPSPIIPKPFIPLSEHPEVFLANPAPSDVRQQRGASAQRTQSEEDELALVLALSQSESTQRQLMLEKLSSQEEEDLARAMAASLSLGETVTSTSSSRSDPAFSEPSLSYTSEQFNAARQRPISTADNDKPISQESPHSPQTPTPRITRCPVADAESIRALANEDSSESNDYTSPVSPSRTIPYASVRPSADPSDNLRVADNYEDDEAFARRLAEEEENHQSPNPAQSPQPGAGTVATPYSTSNHVHSPLNSQSVTVEEGSYTRLLADQQAGSDNTNTASASSATSEPDFTPSCFPAFDPPTYEAATSPSLANHSPADDTNLLSTASAISRHGSVRSHPPAQLESQRPEHASSTNRLPRTKSSISIGSTQKQQNTLPQPTQLMARSASTTSLSSLAMEHAYQEPAPDSSTHPINPYVAEELLSGVSIGFDAPVMSTQLTMLQGPMPSIISLPYGRNLPLHIQAPNWRHMLRLMARLPGTTIQATIEAMAMTKSEFKLRTVVQLVKPHLVSSEWRTVLWFTLDHPVPQNVTGSSRYMTDVNVLPWSYTFSQVPQLLRDSSDTQISKTYTIPACSAVPFPTLPITFPDLAMYLQASLESSRRYINDSSSGVRKLAKMIETCYPDMNADNGDDPERRSVGGLFRRVIGRNNRRRGGNEDTYDLVTPFVTNEWG